MGTAPGRLTPHFRAREVGPHISACNRTGRGLSSGGVVGSCGLDYFLLRPWTGACKGRRAGDSLPWTQGRVRVWLMIACRETR